jgi:hypothetical protein
LAITTKREDFSFKAFSGTLNGTITVFDAPGGASTNVTGISADGSVIGWSYIQGLLQGFVRDARGTFTTFACPASFSTSPSSINEAGEITGTCGSHGFVRSPQGTITVFDPPQGGFGSLSINRAGVIAGYYYVSGPGPHGFLRSPQGAITLIDIPGALNTQINGINDFETIAGFYSVDIGLPEPIYHGFLRSPQGTITSFDFPGAVATMATSINDFGVVAGTYFAPPAFTASGFLRLPAGFESESDH